MKTKFTATALGACLLTACATATPISSRPNLASMANTQGAAADKGILIIDTKNNLGCTSLRMGLSGGVQQSIYLTDYTSKASGPAVKIVEPGKYRFFSSTCSIPGYYPSNLPQMELWFGSIEVKAGETIYAGTLNSSRVDVKSKLEGAEAIWGVLSNYSTKKETTYLTYEFTNNSDWIKQALREQEEPDQNMIEIADRMVYRPPLSIMDKEEYQSAILRAYSKTEDGKTPTKSEVDIRFREEMKTAIKNSLRKLGTKMGLTDEIIENSITDDLSKT